MAHLPITYILEVEGDQDPPPLVLSESETVSLLEGLYGTFEGLSGIGILDKNKGFAKVQLKWMIRLKILRDRTLLKISVQSPRY